MSEGQATELPLITSKKLKSSSAELGSYNIVLPAFPLHFIKAITKGLVLCSFNTKNKNQASLEPR
jgi:hypothetical protein